jgi:hypothetical protein
MSSLVIATLIRNESLDRFAITSPYVPKSCTDGAAHKRSSWTESSVDKHGYLVAQPMLRTHIYVEAFVAVDRLATRPVTLLTARRFLEALLAFALQLA